MCIASGSSEFSKTIDAIRHYTDHIQAGEASGEIYLKRAGAYQQIDSLKIAIDDYDAALNFDPPLTRGLQAQTYDARSQCYRRGGDYDAAIADSERSVELAPDVARYRANLGFAYHWVGRLDEALQQYTQALAIDVEDWWTYIHRGQTHMLLGNTAQAISDFMAVREDEATPQLRWWRAQAYLLNKEYEKAEMECALGLSKPPQDAQLWCDLWLTRGWACYAQNHLEGALSDFLEALRQKPSALAHLGRGLTYRALGFEQAAADDLSVFVGYHAGNEGLALYQLSQAFDVEMALQLAALRMVDRSLPQVALKVAVESLAHEPVPA